MAAALVALAGLALSAHGAQRARSQAKKAERAAERQAEEQAALLTKQEEAQEKTRKQAAQKRRRQLAMVARAGTTKRPTIKTGVLGVVGQPIQEGKTLLGE